MRLLWLATGLMVAWSAPACADACDVQTAEMVQATGARFDHRSPSGENVFLRHPFAREFVMNCRDKGLVGQGNISLSFDGAYPTSGYFDLIALAAASSLRIPAAEAKRLAMKCHKAGLAASDELAEAGSKIANVECQSFRRDGGGTNIIVWPPRKD